MHGGIDTTFKGENKLIYNALLLYITCETPLCKIINLATLFKYFLYLAIFKKTHIIALESYFSLYINQLGRFVFSKFLGRCSWY